MRSCGAILGEYGAPPPRLVNWLQDQSRLYFEETKAKRFRLHNLRGTAVSRARMAGVAESDAAVAFGCNPSTMPESQKRRMEAIKPVRGESQAAETARLLPRNQPAGTCATGTPNGVLCGKTGFSASADDRT